MENQNEKFKQDAITKAYGEYWEVLKDLVDENGWVLGYTHVSGVCGFDSNEIEQNKGGWRPKSLSGIVNNNGWISAKQETDYFQDWQNAWVFSGIIEYGTWNPIQQYWMDVEGVVIKNATHYQLIQKPKPPIY